MADREYSEDLLNAWLLRIQEYSGNYCGFFLRSSSSYNLYGLLAEELVARGYGTWYPYQITYGTEKITTHYDYVDKQTKHNEDSWLKQPYFLESDVREAEESGDPFLYLNKLTQKRRDESCAQI